MHISQEQGVGWWHRVGFGNLPPAVLPDDIRLRADQSGVGRTPEREWSGHLRLRCADLPQRRDHCFLHTLQSPTF